MQVRLVFEDGRHEVMLRSAAQSLADRRGLEIVQVGKENISLSLICEYFSPLFQPAWLLNGQLVA